MSDIKNIEITNEDRKKYSAAKPKAKSSAIAVSQKDRSVAIIEPLDLPRLPTIGDVRFESGLSVQDENTLRNLAESYPKASFDNVTQKEAAELEAYSHVTNNMDRSTIWDIIKPYFPSVFNVELGDKLSKMREIEKRSGNDFKYVPTQEWLVEICRRIIHSRIDLFKFNVDFSARAFDHREHPINFLLMLIKAQREMYPKRKHKLSDTFFSKFLVLMQGHAELMIKLKLINKKGDDFYGSKYEKIRDSLRITKGIIYSTLNGKPLTIKQQTLLINIIDDYKTTLELIFVAEPYDKDLFDSQLDRPFKDVKVAATEVHIMFDDSNTRSSRGRANSYRAKDTSCEVINSIYLKSKNGRSIDDLYKGFISMPHLEEYLAEYFIFDNETDRSIIRQKAIDKKSDVYVVIANLFFETIDKYMVK